MPDEKIQYNTIKSALAAKGKRNLDLAVYLNMKPTLVSKFVSNARQPPIPLLFKIAEFFNCEPGELLASRNSIPVIKEIGEEPQQ